MTHTAVTPASTNPTLDLLFHIYLVGRKMKQLAKNHHQVKTQDLLLEMGVLQLVANQARSISELAQLLSMGISATSERVKSLVIQGYIEQLPGTDARQIWCHITPAGAKHLEKTQTHVLASCPFFQTQLAAQDITRMKNFLVSIIATKN